MLGVGLLAMAYSNNEQRRETFLELLADELRKQGLIYASATFGRAAGNVPVWSVTLRSPEGGIQTRRVELPQGTEPYSRETCDAVVRAVVARS